MLFLLLCVAGIETTRNAITWGMMAFFDFGDQWEKFVADPDRYMETAVEEIVRWATPVLHFRRQAVCDYELGGVRIAAGDKVVFWHAAANRDPRAFETRGASTSSAPPTTTSASAGADPTTAWAPAWPAWRSA